MPTRSGLDFHTIAPTHYVCAYCYQASLAIPYAPFMYSGMITKRVHVRLDDSLTDFAALPQYTQIWTEPHCYPCHRKVIGFPMSCKYRNSFKYD